MELDDIYENIDRSRGDRKNQENVESEQGVRSADPVRGKCPPLVIPILLGLSILLSVVILGTAIILFSQIFNEMKTIDANFKKELSQVTSNVSQMCNEMKTIDANFKKELSQVTSNGTRLSKEVTSLLAELAELKSEISKLKENPQVECPDQWKRFQQNFYYFSSVKKNYADAQRSCTTMHTNLVVINSAAEQAFIQQWIQKGSHWIGLSDSISEGDWRWVDGTDYASSVKFWSPDEPNDANNNEDCAELLVFGEWNDTPCNVDRYWTCEKSA
ncbi:CD209 antigen-like protein C [Scyliorhinus canicula]|uniref:CD209 antigen-like protein C n=1 Tax=Scyliorhinus canicula TaxID=7830 RepID=UPI0018F2D488|nr:CD209 antigen-like protein C [Scyliorhinus canicula]